jgi:hypothetical protein
MSIFFFGSYYSFLLAPPSTPPCPPCTPPSPQKLNLFVIGGRIVTLEGMTFDVNRHPRLWLYYGALLLDQGVNSSRGQLLMVKR